MKEIININSISSLVKLFKSEKARHPLIAVVDLSKIRIGEEWANVKMSTAMYGISLKTKSNHQLRYGRSIIDFAEGSLYGCGPGQVLEVTGSSEEGELEGWALYFHPDLLLGHDLEEKITRYGFFDYDTNEALHLSDQEKETLHAVIEQIKLECENNIDEFSKDVLVSNIELLLNYIRRYYNRQFITRKSHNSDLLSRFEREIHTYFASDSLEQNGLPTVQHFASALNLSSSYLSDLFTEHSVDYNLRDPFRLEQPKFNTIKFGFKSFRYYGAKLWNSLPTEVKDTDDINVFKRMLTAWCHSSLCSEIDII